MKSILLFGAGKSSGSLIDYLGRLCIQKQWQLTIADSDGNSLESRFGRTSGLFPVQVDVQNSPERQRLIEAATLVISLLPPHLHVLVAQDCLTYNKNLLTASYVQDDIRKLADQIREKKLLFLCEMGLDPGIDHMSAMEIIHRIQAQGGNITGFRSHTGGLVAPESDDNSWHYKISWNPANVVKAGSDGAVYKEEGKIKSKEYKNLFENAEEVAFRSMGRYAFYPNRDSLAYISLYGLESAATFIRTTLRHPDYCRGWKNLVQTGLTDDRTPVPSTITTVATWSKPLIPFLDDTNRHLYAELGLFDDTPVPQGVTSAKILQGILEKKWQMKETDRDMILMLHEFEYELNQQVHHLKSSLMVTGENAVRTAMAKTVGLPLGIAARLILENKMPVYGLHIPITPEIYEPVLRELALEGIVFEEEFS